MARIRFSSKKPKLVDVLIYDSVGSENIKASLGNRTKWGIIEVRDIEINVHPIMFPNVISVVLRLMFLKLRQNEKFELRIALELALIKARRAKLVITNIDNSRRFSALSRIYGEAKFLAVQNAFRTDEIDDVAKYLCVTNFFCFGKETIDRYVKAGCSIDQYTVLGSLRNGLYRRAFPGKREKKYDLCFVSQYKQARFQVSMPELKQTSIRLLEFSERYCLENDRKLVIAGNAKDKRFPYEFQYFLENLTNRNIQFKPNNQHSFSSYRTIDESEVTVVINSTIGYESMARGQKVLFCNFSENPYYDVPGRYRDGVWSLSGGDVNYGMFSKRLDELFQMTTEEWASLTREMAEYFVHEDSGRLPQDVLTEQIGELLTKTDRRA